MWPYKLLGTFWDTEDYTAMVGLLAGSKYSLKSIKKMNDEDIEVYHMYEAYDTDAKDLRLSSLTTRQGNWSFDLTFNLSY